MMSIEWDAVAVGMVVGTAMSAIFFVGLGLGIRFALQSTRPAAALLVSAFVRIALLLGVGWLLFGVAGVWSLAGYAAAFLVIRLTTTAIASIGLPSGDPQ